MRKARVFLAGVPIVTVAAGLALTLLPERAAGYPPAVGILGKAKGCLACHANNGPWQDDAATVIDIVDQASGSSLKQPDGSFSITASRGETRTVLTVLGRVRGDSALPPYRNAWLYVDPSTIATGSLSKFAPGWEVNLPMGCRIAGDRLALFDGALISVLPMTVRAGDGARDAEIALQVMLTRGESVKGKPKEGMIGSYFERRVHLRVMD